MGVPGQIPPIGPGPGRGSGHGPFGDKAFRGALVVCAVLVGVGIVLVGASGQSGRAVGTAFLVLGALGLLTGGGGLALEARMRRRAPEPPSPPPPPPPPPAGGLPRTNGRAPHPPDLSRVRKPPRRAP